MTDYERIELYREFYEDCLKNYKALSFIRDDETKEKIDELCQYLYSMTKRFKR